ncbi:RT0821/Lpp0805 family surface protein [Alphaproteobacteria bacterium]|nr:RT0821/Lpp0805 family surface protein [Alphaproteobacteria bacterium]
MKKFALSIMVLSVFALGACESLQSAGTKQTVGGVGGAVLGGLAGSKVGGGSGQLWATGAGALIGALVGSEIGRSLDKADMAYAQSATERAHTAPIGEQVSWVNPQSGNSGSVMPQRDGYSSSGRYCREYEQTIVVDGQQQTAVGQACQNSDGTWQIVG